jgi:hypothetical protein
MAQPEWEEFKEQILYLKERGHTQFSIRRCDLEVKTATWLFENGFPRIPGLSKGIVWKLRDLMGVETGKLGARVWYQRGIIVDPSKPKFLMNSKFSKVPGVYYSPLANWDNLEYGQRIYFCESFLKADIACSLGFHAVGISGCWGWSTGGELNYEFKQLPWTDLRLKPAICFDSNVCEDKPNLLLAARRLSAALEVHQRVHSDILFLPPQADGSHWGLDDYYQEHGKEPTLAFLNGEGEPLPSEMSDHLNILNDQVVVCRSTNRVIDIEHGYELRKSDFEGVSYANRIVWRDDKPIQVAKVWMQWEYRREVQDIKYRPGEERIVGTEYYNLWKEMGCVPLAADVSLFTQWVDDIFDSDVEREYFLDWWAWQLQNLGGKLTTALVVIGPPGIGKGWVSEIMQRIFGRDNVAKAPLTVLERPFNADIAAKQLFIIEETDEVGGGGTGGRVYNNLKDLITSTTIRLEKKGVDARLIDNCLNCFLTGNNVGIFKLDHGDRRMAVLECVECEVGSVANNQSYWDPRWKWLEEGFGAEAIYGYLLNRDLRGFNPKGMAPLTRIKGDMVEMLQTTHEAWIADLLEAPDNILQQGFSEVDGNVASARELAWLFERGRLTMTEIEAKHVMVMNRALKNARVEMANDGKKIKGELGIPTRYFMVRQPAGPVYSWAGEVNDRLFWRRLRDSEQGQGSQEGENGSQKY